MTMPDPPVAFPDEMGRRPPEGVTRLLCWNVNNRIATWRSAVEIARRLGVDLALLQEAPHPKGEGLDSMTTWPDAADKTAWHTWKGPDSVGRRWCAALAWFPWTQGTVNPELRVPIAEANWDEPTISHPGQFAVARFTAPGKEPLTLISLYGIWDAQPFAMRPRRTGFRWQEFPDTTLHRALSDLTPILQSGERVVIAGDLNILHGYGELDDWVVRSQPFFDRLRAYGVEVVGPFRPAGELLPDCACGSGDRCRHVSTRPDTVGAPWQLDYVLSNLDEEHFETWTLPIVSQWSDHAPIIIDVRLGEEHGIH